MTYKFDVIFVGADPCFFDICISKLRKTYGKILNLHDHKLKFMGVDDLFFSVVNTLNPYFFKRYWSVDFGTPNSLAAPLV